MGQGRNMLSRDISNMYYPPQLLLTVAIFHIMVLSLFFIEQKLDEIKNMPYHRMYQIQEDFDAKQLTSRLAEPVLR